jgi:hypothetical protein
MFWVERFYSYAFMLHLIFFVIHSFFFGCLYLNSSYSLLVAFVDYCFFFWGNALNR